MVCDYVMSWLAAAGTIAALKRRATEGGSYVVQVSLARICLWLLDLGIFDKNYVAEVAGVAKGHEYLPPQTFEAETQCGHYQGVTDQVMMSATPGSYRFPLIPRGSSTPIWLPRA